MSVFKACDIRGIVGADLDPALATRIGRAIGTRLRGRSVVVGGDVRVSTPALKAALLRGLAQTPCDAIDIGTVPTPAVYDAVAAFGAGGGVMVTASHNPAAHNGFKLVLATQPVTPDDIAAIARTVEDGTFAVGTGRRRRVDAVDGYVARIRARAAPATPLRIVVDGGNGAAGPVAVRLLRALGHEVIERFTEPDGRFPNRSPDPSEAGALTVLQDDVVRLCASFGVAFDGDGDRAVFVDETGRVTPAEETLVVFARAGLRPGDAVVYDLKSSSVVAAAIAALGGRPVMERSGHAFIRATFLREGAALAGEVSGHFSFRELGYDDGIYAAARMADVLAASGRGLARATADLPRPVITPDLRIAWPLEDRDRLLERVRAGFAGRPITTLDGVRVTFDDGWLLARASVTEPAVTFRIEARDTERLRERRDALVAAVPELARAHPFFDPNGDGRIAD